MVNDLGLIVIVFDIGLDCLICCLVWFDCLVYWLGLFGIVAYSV